MKDSKHESPLKRLKPSNVDRLTNLPDALITHILSLMPVKTAIKTQLLSKQWRYAWTSSPGLIYSGPGVLENKDLRVINNALMLHKGPIVSLSLLNIGCLSDRSDPPVNVWVQCAVDKKIEVLVLEVNDYPKSYLLPHSFFLCDTLREFCLIASEFDPGSSVFWKSLKKLTLGSVENLSSDKIRKIITGSPVLESLNLLDCAGFNQIVVSSTSKLRNLAISNQDEDANNVEKSAEWLKISAPSITSLDISGNMGHRYCKIDDVSSLVQVNFRFRMSAIAENHEVSKLACRRMMYWLLRNTSHVEKLSLGTWCMQVWSFCELGGRPTTSLKCKTLEIDSLNERSIPGIARLLRSSLHLEKLTINMDRYRSDQVYNVSELSEFNGEKYWKLPERANIKNIWQHLKVVQFIGSFDTIGKKTLMLELAEYVLGHAKVLDMLVLKPTEHAYQECQPSDLRYSDLFYVMKKLLSYPRCSDLAKVLPL